MTLHYQTVSPVLLDCLHRLMSHPAFNDLQRVTRKLAERTTKRVKTTPIGKKTTTMGEETSPKLQQ